MKNINWKKYAGTAMAAAMIPALAAPIATEAANSETVDLKSLGYSIANADGFDSDGVAFFYYENHDRNLQDIDLTGGSLAETLNKVIDDRNNTENSTYGFSDTVTVSGASSTGILGGVPNEWVETDCYMLEIRHGGEIYEIPFRIKPGGTYEIQSKSSGMFLGVENSNSSSAIQQQNEGQKWIIQETRPGGNVYTIKNENTGMYMDVPGSSTSNGTKIIQHQYNGGHENQQWILIKHEDGYYSIKNVNSNLNLDIPGESKNSGVPLIQFTEHNNENQLFKLIKK